MRPQGQKGRAELKDILNKYVGMDSETRKQTVIAFLTALIDFLTAFHIIEFTDEQIQALYKLALCIATAIVWGYCSHYRNNNYTPEGVAGTIVTREMKELRDETVADYEEPEDSYVEEVENDAE